MIENLPQGGYETHSHISLLLGLGTGVSVDGIEDP